MDSFDSYENAFKGLPLGFSIVDKQGLIVDFNKAAEEITGYSREEMTGKSHLEILHGTTNINKCPLTLLTLEKQKKTVSAETRVRRKDGEDIIIEVTSFPLYEDDGEFAGGVEIFRDITELKSREKERNDFLSMFVHDMKNPVMTSKGFILRMLSGKPGPLTEKQRKYVQIVHDGLSRLETLITDYLDYSRMESRKYKPSLKQINLHDIIQQNIDALKVRIEESGVKIEFHSRRETAEIEADEMMINRILTNLLSNSIAYTESGRTVSVNCVEKDGNVLVEVSNPGEISEEQIPHIFDAFHRVTKEKGGSGLGLAIAKQMVELHKGKIWVEVTPDHYTVFSFMLPKKQK